MKLGQWIGVLALAIALYILWQIRNVLLLIFAAIVVAVALNTLARQMQKLHVARSLSILAAILFLLALMTGVVLIIVPPFADQFQQLTSLVPKGIDRVNLWSDQLRNLAPPFLVPYLPDFDTLIEQSQPFFQRMLSGSVAVFSGTLGAALNILLVLVLTLMLLANPPLYRQTFIRLFPAFYRRRIDFILDRCEAALRGWLIGILVNMSIIGIFSGIGLWILQVPLPLANGILAGLLTFIPNIGPALSVVPPMAIALLDAPWKAIAVLVVYFFVQQLETNLLTPYVMAHQVSLLPAVTLMSQVFFATFFGFLGLLLALPLTVVAQVWLHEILVKDVLDKWEHWSHEEVSGRADDPIGRWGNRSTPADEGSYSIYPELIHQEIHVDERPSQ